MVVEALLGEGRIIDHGALQPDVGHIQSAQLGQGNITAGGPGIQGAGVDGAAGFDHDLHLRGADGHDLDGGHAGGGTVEAGGIGTGSGQGCSAHDQTNQRGAGGDEHLIRTVDIGDIQSVGMAQVGEILGAGGSVGHVGQISVGLSQTNDGGSGIIATDLGAIDVIGIHRHALHAVAAAHILNDVHGAIITVVQLGQCVQIIHCLCRRSRLKKQSSHEHQTQAQGQKPFAEMCHNLNLLFQFYHTSETFSRL